MALTPEMKINRWGKGKYLLRHAFEGDYLPEDILMREKAAFSDAEYNEWRISGENDRGSEIRIAQNKDEGTWHGCLYGAYC